MDINEIIRNRRAVPPRFLSKKEVDKVLVQQLLENANWAPNHKKTEPWRFKVYTGEAKQILSDEIFDTLKKQLEEGVSLNWNKIEKFKTHIEHVPVVIAVVMQRDKSERLPEWEEIAAVSMAVQNMWLTATAMDLGAFFSTPEFLPRLNDVLNITHGQRTLGFFFVGHMPMEYPSPGRGAIDEKVEWM